MLYLVVSEPYQSAISVNGGVVSRPTLKRRFSLRMFDTMSKLQTLNAESEINVVRFYGQIGLS